MGAGAKVTSLEAIEAFRAAILIYITKARPALEEAAAEAVRVRVWLENEQRRRWEAELRKRMRTLEQAQQALFSGRISNLRDETAAEVMAVHRAKRAVEEAQEKLRAIKRWNREFESRVQPLVKQLEKLHAVLSMDLPKGAAHLAELLRSLEAYAEAKAPLPREPVAAGGQPSQEQEPEREGPGA